MWPWYRYWHPWVLRWSRPWWGLPYPWPWVSIPKEQEIAMLEEQSRILEHELGSIKKRLENLKKQEVKHA